MTTLIIPCAGKSTRFPNMKPKWMLTHPDGKLMVEKSIEGLNLEIFDRIIITIVKQHSNEFDAKIILDQMIEFSKNEHLKKVEILELTDFTNCQSETIFQTVIQKNVSGAIVIKDSDNQIFVNLPNQGNFVVGLNIETFQNEIYRLKAKSFLKTNEQNQIIDIIEKKISSNIICLGVYGFESAEMFCDAYLDLKKQQLLEELFVSHVISFLIGTNTAIFHFLETKKFEDWGTLQDWMVTQKKHMTYFFDIDGVLLENRGKYGKENWNNCLPVIQKNLEYLKKLQKNGAQIVITTSRNEFALQAFQALMKQNDIHIHAYVPNCNHAPRIIINDFAPTNPYPSCSAINIPRNESLENFLVLYE